jgi:SAM-dependent methyltransferase
MIERIYDTVNGDQYSIYAEFVKKCFVSQSDIPVREVLDLGCGTGGITARLADMGYDTVGVDISPEMLMYARENTYGKDVLLLNQDMRSFELYGTVQGIVCSFDTLNYLSNEEELTKTLSLCRLYMEKGGVMVCDINSLYRYEKVYANNVFVYEVEDDMLVWQNEWNSEKEECTFYLTMFTAYEDGYSREDEVNTQKYFSPETFKRCARKAGFETINIYGEKDLSVPAETSEKLYITLK